MIWIGIHLLIGVIVFAWLVLRGLLLRGMTYDVQVGDVLAAPFLIILWPGVVVFILLEDELLTRHLFTIGKHHDNQD